MAVWCKFHCKSSNFGTMTTGTKIWLQLSLPWSAANGRTPIQVTLWEFILGTTQSRCQLIQGLNHWQWETSASLGGFKQLKWRIHGDIWGYNMIKWTFYGSTCFQSPSKRWFLGCVVEHLTWLKWFRPSLPHTHWIAIFERRQALYILPLLGWGHPLYSCKLLGVPRTGHSNMQRIIIVRL